eukprot:117512-Pelagomonas_calceolata.AAC.1
MDSERSENLQWNASKSDGLAACWPVLARQKRTSIGGKKRNKGMKEIQSLMYKGVRLKFRKGREVEKLHSHT